MEELALLGNAAAVPVIIFITQLIKKNFSFKYRSDVISLILAVPICFGWAFYTTSNEVLVEQFSGFLVGARSFIDLLVISFATWLSASKLYDIGLGKKKQQAKFKKEKEEIVEEHVQERKKLEDEVIKLKNGNGGKDEPVEEDPAVSSKLLEILERK